MKEDVVRLDVTMNHAGAMGVFEPLEDADHHSERRGDVDWAAEAQQELADGEPAERFHHEERARRNARR